MKTNEATGSADFLVEARDLAMEFRQGRFSGKKVVHALNGVSLGVRRGETLGLVGETGCGKSTLCRAMLRLYEPTAGSVYLEGRDITRLSERALRPLRRDMQLIFQDPADSMNARLNVGAIIEEPLEIQTDMKAAERRAAAMTLLGEVGLPEDSYLRYPHEFSGGQRQRIAIARALALKPKLVVCDEPVSALDVSVQSQILNLLLSLQAGHGLTMIFVSHALSVVRHMSDRVAVMYLGSVMELADSLTIYREPRHPYTQALIAAIPKADPGQREQAIPFTGEIPSPIDLPAGCPFRLNCPRREARCAAEKPALRELASGHFCACHFA
jgi:oligopeptide/dipeptide ABC transporter ATP-binding protein